MIRARMLALLGILAASVARADDPTTTTLRVKLVVPDGVEAGALTATLFDDTFSNVERDLKPIQEFDVDARGLFQATHAPGPKTQFEVTGPGVRRARFPWSDDVARDPNGRAVFHLEPGATINGIVRSAIDATPVANATIGPMEPGEDIDAINYEKSFPFYARTASDGRASITGALAGTSYYIQVKAPGFERRRVKVAAGDSFQIDLKPGGLSVSGVLVGSKSLAPFPQTVLKLRGGPESLNVWERSDDKGGFRFDGLPAGNYEIAPFVTDVGEVEAQSISIVEGVPLEGLSVFVPEGVAIRGFVSDFETGTPVANASLTLRDTIVYSGAEGQFEFSLVKGPWPLKPTFEHPEYRLLDEDQPSANYPFNGFPGKDLDVVLKARRKRFLDIRRTIEPGQPESVVLELWGPVTNKEVEPVRHPVAGAQTTVMLDSAGTRFGFARSADGLASDMAVVKTAADQTTTTLLLTMGAGATIDGVLAFPREDPPREPIAPAFRVSLTTTADGAVPVPVEIVTARPTVEGAFTLPGLPPGKFTLRLLRPEGEPYLERDVVLERGQTVRIDETIARGLAVAGRVVDSDGVAKGEIALSAYGTDPTGKPLHLKAMSKLDGTFSFDGFGGATLAELSASHVMWADWKRADIPLPADNIEVKLVPRSAIKVTLEASSDQISGAQAFVFHGLQKPAPDGTSQWFYEQDTSASFDTAGVATLSPRSEGRIRVAVEADGAWDVSRAMEWSQGSQATEVKLRPGSFSGVEVTVPGGTEESLRSTEVTLMNTVLPEGRAPVEFAPVLRAPNLLVFDRIPAGEYMLVAFSATGGTATRTNIDVASGETARLEMALETPTLELAGKLLLEGNPRTPVAGATVRLRFGDVPEPPVLAEETTRADGSFVLFPVTAGRPHLVEVEAPNLTRTFTVDTRDATGTRIEREFVVSAPIETRLFLPARLRAEAEKNPAVPFVMNGEDGKNYVLRLPDLERTHAMSPGKYSVSWGERSIGELTVQAVAKPPAEATLPDLPN